MCSTPAPPSTPRVAAATWSGTGEVNTSPAQAASSMPGPTNPACIGSCPDPPPGTSPTLPRTGASPRNTTRWSCSTLSSGWSAAMPRSASATTSSGALMSFFISAPDVAVTSDEGARWQEARRPQPAHTSSARTDGLWARDVGPVGCLGGPRVRGGLLHRRRWTGGDDARAPPGPPGRGGDGAGEARGLPAGLPGRHRPSLDAAPARRAAAGRRVPPAATPGGDPAGRHHRRRHLRTGRLQPSARQVPLPRLRSPVGLSRLPGRPGAALPQLPAADERRRRRPAAPGRAGHGTPVPDPWRRRARGPRAADGGGGRPQLRAARGRRPRPPGVRGPDGRAVVPAGQTARRIRPVVRGRRPHHAGPHADPARPRRLLAVRLPGSQGRLRGAEGGRRGVVPRGAGPAAARWGCGGGTPELGGRPGPQRAGGPAHPVAPARVAVHRGRRPCHVTHRRRGHQPGRAGCRCGGPPPRRSTAGRHRDSPPPRPRAASPAAADRGHAVGAAADPDAGAEPDPGRRPTDRHTTAAADPGPAPRPAGPARPGHRDGRAARARHAGHVPAVGARGRGSSMDGAVGVGSLVAVAAVSLLVPVILGLLPRLLVPQVVLLLVGGMIIGPHVLAVGSPGDVQLLADVGLGFVFLLAGY